MEMHEFKPSAALEQLVVGYYVLEDDASPAQSRLQPILPSAIQSIIVLFGQPCQTIACESGDVRDIVGSLVIGPVTERRLYFYQTTPVGIFGILFYPTGFNRLFGLPMAVLTDTTAALEAATGTFGRALTSRVQEAENHAQRVAAAEALLLEQLRRRQPQLGALESVVATIQRREGLVSVDELAYQANMSSRQLERRFREAVGVPPKLFAEISRFTHVFRLLRKNPLMSWQDVSYSCGYFDQAHFNHHFRRFAGEAPRCYFQHGYDFDKIFWGR